MYRVRFSEPYRTGHEADYVLDALGRNVWHGDGEFTAQASAWLERHIGAPHALLTTSCTHAIEMATLLLDLKDGDEVICPSFTFPSLPAAVALRGATPVFVDVRPDTLNLDPQAAKNAINATTKAIFVVHYGGVSADVEAFGRLADAHGLAIVEDNAHSLGAYYKGRHLGTFGDFATQSFHDTKNVTCGEGGALLINDENYIERAEIIREKGTNRSSFLRGQVDKYTWVDKGSSYLPSDILAAILLAQLEQFEWIQENRHRVWRNYHSELGDWGRRNGVTTMTVPPGCQHSAHLYYLLMPTHSHQRRFIAHLARDGIAAAFHYQPLDSSPAGRRYGRTPVPCDVSADVAHRIVRLPLHPALSNDDLNYVLESIERFKS